MWGLSSQEEEEAKPSPGQPIDDSNKLKAREDSIRKLLELCVVYV